MQPCLSSWVFCLFVVVVLLAEFISALPSFIPGYFLIFFFFFFFFFSCCKHWCFQEAFVDLFVSLSTFVLWWHPVHVFVCVCMPPALRALCCCCLILHSRACCNNRHSAHVWWIVNSFFFFCIFRAVPAAYGCSQSRGWIRAIVAGLRHSYSSAYIHHSIWQHQIPNPLSKARGWTCIVMGTSWVCYCWATTGTLKWNILIGGRF